MSSRISKTTPQISNSVSVCHHPNCGKVYASSTNMMRHAAKAHKDTTAVMCTYSRCYRWFDTQAEMEKHTLGHRNSGLQYCMVAKCTKYYTTKGNLDRHIAREHAEYRRECPYDGCTQAFISPRGLSRHKRIVHGEWDGKPYKFVCHDCSARFTSKGNLKRHNQQIHDRSTRIRNPARSMRARELGEGGSDYDSGGFSSDEEALYVKQAQAKSHVRRQEQVRKGDYSSSGSSSDLYSSDSAGRYNRRKGRPDGMNMYNESHKRHMHRSETDSSTPRKKPKREKLAALVRAAKLSPAHSPVPASPSPKMSPLGATGSGVKRTYAHMQNSPMMGMLNLSPASDSSINGLSNYTLSPPNTSSGQWSAKHKMSNRAPTVKSSMIKLTPPSKPLKPLPTPSTLSASLIGTSASMSLNLPNTSKHKSIGDPSLNVATPSPPTTTLNTKLAKNSRFSLKQLFTSGLNPSPLMLGLSPSPMYTSQEPEREPTPLSL